MRRETKLAGFCSLLVFGSCILGCAVFESGPMMMKATSDNIAKVIEQALAQMDMTQMTANAGAKINDPRFSVHGHFATGVIYRVNVELIGADMDVAVAAAGVGDAARNVEGNPPATAGGG